MNLKSCPRCLRCRIAGVLRIHSGILTSRSLNSYKMWNRKKLEKCPRCLRHRFADCCACPPGVLLLNESLLYMKISNQTIVEPGPHYLLRCVRSVLRTHCRAPPFKWISNFHSNLEPNIPWTEGFAKITIRNYYSYFFK